MSLFLLFLLISMIIIGGAVFWTPIWPWSYGPLFYDPVIIAYDDDWY